MASLGKAMFKGDSGKHYRFKVFPLGTHFRKISGIYLIACRATALTADIDTRFSMWATPKISRSRSTSIARPKTSCGSGPIAYASSLTSRKNLVWQRNGTCFPPSVRRVMTERQVLCQSSIEGCHSMPFPIQWVRPLVSAAES